MFLLDNIVYKEDAGDDEKIHLTKNRRNRILLVMKITTMNRLQIFKTVIKIKI
jgi:hypothetical protein